jgi:hypothetical protein
MNKVVDNDEIKLVELILILWKWKYIIVSLSLVAVVSSFFYVKSLDNVYEARVQLKLTDKKSGGLSSFAADSLSALPGFNMRGGQDNTYDILRSILYGGTFLPEFILKNNFQSKIFDNYDEKKDNPDFKENINFIINSKLKSVINFREEKSTGLVILAYQSKDREFTKVFVDALLKDLNIKYREFELSNLQTQIDKYENEIDKTHNLILKNKLAELVSKIIQEKVIGQAQEYYGFDIVVDSYVPEVAEKVKPKRFFLLMTMSVISFMSIVLFVFLLDFILKLRMSGRRI